MLKNLLQKIEILFIYILSNNSNQLQKMSESNIVKVYIPRILGNIRKQTVIDTFNNLKIGNVFYIDMHFKLNENKNPYYFAFISIQLFDTHFAKNFSQILNCQGITRVKYNSHNDEYWEVKKHVERTTRSSTSKPIQYTFEVSFTEKDKNDLENEYDELQREIFKLCIC